MKIVGTAMKLLLVNWYDKPESKYEFTLTSQNLPKTIKETRDDILKQTIKCKTQENLENKKNNPACTTAFRITELELTLYKKLGIPVPEFCFPCRRTARFALLNPRKLWHRSCMCGKQNHGHDGKCIVQFETSYAPDRPEIVYCEKCYQQEVV